MPGRNIILGGVCLILAASAAAEDRYSLTTPVRPQMELTTNLSEELNVRFGVSQDDNRYSFDPRTNIGRDRNPISASALVDWRPTPSGFRVTGGALYGNRVWGGGAVDGATAGFAASGWSQASLDAAAERITPYLGVGWGTTFTEDDRFGVQLDMGLMLDDEHNTGPGASTAFSDSGVIGDSLEAQFDGLNYTPMFSADMYLRF